MFESILKGFALITVIISEILFKPLEWLGVPSRAFPSFSLILFLVFLYLTIELIIYVLRKLSSYGLKTNNRKSIKKKN